MIVLLDMELTYTSKGPSAHTYVLSEHFDEAGDLRDCIINEREELDVELEQAEKHIYTAIGGARDVDYEVLMTSMSNLHERM